MKNEKEIQEQIDKLQKQKDYLREFLTTKLSGGDSKGKVEQELIPLQREINSLKWVIDSDLLPF